MTNAIQGVKRGLMWAWGHKVRTVVLLVVFTLLAPKPIRSQFVDPCCAILATGLTTISSTLSSVIGGGLNSVLSIEKDISSFEQTVVWPQNLINQARSLAGSVQGIFNQIQGVMRIPVNSATLPATQQFEQTLLSRDPNQIAQTGAQYTAVYGAVPDPTAASPQVRDITDMTDATAQAAMKRAIEIDALADLELRAADQINQSIQTAAPGSAPIIEAQADAWLVRANAYTQSATADLMRVRQCEKRSCQRGRCTEADLQSPEEAVNRVLFSATPPNSAEWDRQRERYGRCVGRCRDDSSPQFSLQRVPGIRLRWRCPDACDFRNQVSVSGTRVRQLRCRLSRRQWNVQFRRQLPLQHDGRRGSLRELDEPVGPVLADQWEYIPMESCHWPGFGSHQPDLDPERVRPIPR